MKPFSVYPVCPFFFPFLDAVTGGDGRWWRWWEELGTGPQLRGSWDF